MKILRRFAQSIQLLITTKHIHPIFTFHGLKRGSGNDVVILVA